MGEKGLEPLRIEIQWLLRPPRLPVPPLALIFYLKIIYTNKLRLLLSHE